MRIGPVDAARIGRTIARGFGHLNRLLVPALPSAAGVRGASVDRGDMVCALVSGRAGVAAGAG
jgi:hypothetical protein